MTALVLTQRITSTRWGTSALTVGAGAVLGFLVGGGGDLGAMIAVLPLALCIFLVPPIAVCIAAATAPWVARLVTTTGIAPRLIDFIDFPLVVAALISALVARQAVRLPRAQVDVLRAIAAFAGAITISWALNPSSPIRLIAGLLLIMQPLLLVAAIMIAPPTREWRRTALWSFGLIMAAQVPVALVQNSQTSDPDNVKGTLFDANAGHHVMAGGAMLAAFVIAACITDRRLVVAGVTTAIALGVMADGKQVFFAAPIGLIVLVLFAGRGSRRSGSNGAAGAIFVLVACVVGLVGFGATDSLESFIENTRETRGGKIALTEAMISDLTEDPLQGTFGFGPGSTVSRFGYLSSVLITEGNPIEALGIGPGARTVEYDELTAGSGFIGESSFSSGQSSLLGVLGDFGFLGALTFAAVVLALMRALWQVSDPLAGAAAAGWAMLLPLGFIFDWLEQPPFTLSLALLTGLALTAVHEERAHDEAVSTS
ncbi:MAG: hypothetical protein AAGD18_02730 [Actinomycetota bacterium]